MVSTRSRSRNRRTVAVKLVLQSLQRGVFLVPLFILVTERFATDEQLDRSLVVENSSVALHSTKTTRRYSAPSLSELTGSFTSDPCSTKGRVRLENIEKPDTAIVLPTRKIPRIIHQTSRSRCLTERVAKTARKWHGYPGYRYYLHDDDAVMRLLQHEFPEFPQLSQMARQCLVHGTIRADVWRYVVLWVYGGYYADIDAVPTHKFHPETSIDSDTDAYFVVEQYHLLSQWFMAVSPRHPIMYYAIQHSLANLVRVVDTGSQGPPFITGPHALHAAYRDFRRDAGVMIDPIAPGNFPVRAGHQVVGTHNRTLTIVGTAADQNEYIQRDALGAAKKREYKKMGMRHFQEDMKHPSGTSCMRALLDEVMRTS